MWYLDRDMFYHLTKTAIGSFDDGAKRYIADRGALSMEDQIDMIQPGKQANLFVIDGNTFTAISVLSRVRPVKQTRRIVFERIDRCEPQPQ